MSVIRLTKAEEFGKRDDCNKVEGEDKGVRSTSEREANCEGYKD